MRIDYLDTAMAAVNMTATLLKRCPTGTLPHAVEAHHLPYRLDEFTFRFTPRTASHRGMLFSRLMQQAVDTDPQPLRELLKPGERPLDSSTAHSSRYPGRLYETRILPWRDTNSPMKWCVPTRLTLGRRWAMPDGAERSVRLQLRHGMATMRYHKCRCVYGGPSARHPEVVP